MGNFQKCLNIVIAEDDEDDYLLFAEALKKEDNIGFINTSGKNPHLIILDLNMPKKWAWSP